MKLWCSVLLIECIVEEVIGGCMCVVYVVCVLVEVIGNMVCVVYSVCTYFCSRSDRDLCACVVYSCIQYVRIQYVHFCRSDRGIYVCVSCTYVLVIK